jgi:hypothetical protein
MVSKQLFVIDEGQVDIHVLQSTPYKLHLTPGFTGSADVRTNCLMFT